jgi:CheY-like chemotaxis protein
VAGQPRLLCIDDEVIGLKVRRAVLERAGYEVVTAPDGKTGIELFEEQLFDGVVVDFLLPDADGGQVALQLRRLRPEVPVMLLSAYPNLPEEVLQRVDCSVMKGMGTEEFLRGVAAMVERRRSGEHASR